MTEALANILIFGLLLVSMGGVFVLHLLNMRRLKAEDDRRSGGSAAAE